jgi:hypothetical protein
MKNYFGEERRDSLSISKALRKEHARKYVEYLEGMQLQDILRSMTLVEDYGDNFPRGV